MNYVRAQNLIDKGRGKAAVRLGQPYDVYRIQPNTAATEYLDPINRIASGFLVLRRPNKSEALIEGTLLSAVPWETLGDFRQWLLGDVFVQNDTVFGKGQTLVTYDTLQMDAFCLAFHGPVKKTMGARLDRLGYVLRPLDSGTDPNGYYAGDIGAAKPLKLVNGVYVWGQNGDAPTSRIPMGVSSRIRARGILIPALPSSVGEPVFVFYIPPLPGFAPKEGDRIQLEDGSRYVVHNPYEQEAGFVGSQITTVREVSQV